MHHVWLSFSEPSDFGETSTFAAPPCLRPHKIRTERVITKLLITFVQQVVISVLSKLEADRANGLGGDIVQRERAFFANFYFEIEIADFLLIFGWGCHLTNGRC